MKVIHQMLLKKNKLKSLKNFSIIIAKIIVMEALVMGIGNMLLF
jgi:hypothetical protein